MFRNKKSLNIVWIVVDTLRADRLGCYGYFRDTSPTIDRLAAEGVLFEDFYCSAFSTGAAFTCLFSGLPAIRSGYYITPAPPSAANMQNFDDAIPTLPEIIQSNSDYTTVGVDNLINFAGHMKQMVRGFEFYINVTRDGGFVQPEYTAGEANARFLPWLRTHSNEKFFAFIHWWDTHHQPYRAPGYRDKFKHKLGSLEGLPVFDSPAGYQYVPGWGRVGELVWGIAERELVRDMDGGTTATKGTSKDLQAINQDLYDCSIAYLDNEVQCIIDTLRDEGTLDQTAILITADHGEGLGNHGTWGHGRPYEDTIHIPLILWRPGLLPEGLRVKGFAQHVDLAPTILELMRIARSGQPLQTHISCYQTWPGGVIDVSMEGVSLLKRIHGEQESPGSIVTEVRRGPGDPGYRVLRSEHWKLIESLGGDKELYNLRDDPMEKTNLANQYSGRTEAMSRQLQDWIKSHLEKGQPDPMRT